MKLIEILPRPGKAPHTGKLPLEDIEDIFFPNRVSNLSHAMLNWDESSGRWAWGTLTTNLNRNVYQLFNTGAFRIV